MNKIELLAPAGDMEKLKAGIAYGADAVYFAGKKFGLRAFSSNFEKDEMKEAVDYAHAHNVKCYITVNILAHDSDFEGLKEYLEYLEKCKVDGVIVADMGIASFVKKYTNLELHVSTQANITNSESAKAWVKLGAKRLVLAREMSVNEVKKIKEAVGDDIDIECFCHGAMCISYSGRCLLSNYFTGRDSNRGACAQPCRWNYSLCSQNVNGEYFPIEEDEKGTYILNSKDMCLIEHLKELIDAGITSFKIEGRMKSPYYVATVVNAYRRAFDNILNNKKDNFDYVKELEKTSHRMFTTGFYFGASDKENIKQSMPIQTHEFMATVLEDQKDGYVLIEMRNRFKVGDELEVLSPTDTFNKKLVVKEMKDEDGNSIVDAMKVQQKIYLKTDLPLKANDFLRKEI
ncbi:MAG: U32 family peptidase [Clostridiales bacterium]|nr:U32 family peptidase [Candidatus Apopatousia equi]